MAAPHPAAAGNRMGSHNVKTERLDDREIAVHHVPIPIQRDQMLGTIGSESLLQGREQFRLIPLWPAHSIHISIISQLPRLQPRRVTGLPCGSTMRVPWACNGGSDWHPAKIKHNTRTGRRMCGVINEY